MIIRCEKCRLHHDDADTERCANAQRLAVVLANAGAVWRRDGEHACPPFKHEQYRASAETFLLHTEKLTEWNDGSMRYLSGACIHCGGSNTIRVGSVAGLEAMRGEVQR